MAPLTRCALWLLLALPAPAHAWTRAGGVWRTLPVGWRWNPASVPPSLGGADRGRLSLEAGFATWASAPCTRFRATNLGPTAVTLGSSRDGVNTLAWVSGSWPPELGAENLTLGATTPLTEAGSFVDVDIVFNAVGFTWALAPGPGVVDAQSIASHEGGHFLGLDHTDERASIMYPGYSGAATRTMSSDDMAGVCALYPADDAGAPAPDASPDAAPPPTPPPTPDGCGCRAGAAPVTAAPAALALLVALALRRRCASRAGPLALRGSLG